MGAGLVINGQIYRGPGGTAGEIGHITLDEAGPVCRCGNRGCLETFVGSRYLLNLLNANLGGDLTLSKVVQLAQQGDLGCRRVIADATARSAAASLRSATCSTPSDHPRR